MGFVPPKRSWMRFIRRGFDQAEAAGHGYVGPEHLLAAILCPAEPTPASNVLESLGLSHADYLERLRSRRSLSREQSDRGTRMNPAAYVMLGRAEGMATAFGAERVEDHHVLLALAYDPMCEASEFAGYENASGPAIVRALEERDIEVPKVPPPPPRSITPFGPSIYYDRAHHDVVSARVREATANREAVWGWQASQWRPHQNRIDGEARLRLAQLLERAFPDIPFEQVDPKVAFEHEYEALHQGKATPS